MHMLNSNTHMLHIYSLLGHDVDGLGLLFKWFYLGKKTVGISEICKMWTGLICIPTWLEVQIKRIIKHMHMHVISKKQMLCATTRSLARETCSWVLVDVDRRPRVVPTCARWLSRGGWWYGQWQTADVSQSECVHAQPKWIQLIV